MWLRFLRCLARQYNTPRQQEWSWPASRRESRAQFVKRLARVARALPEDLVNKAIGDMARRVQKLYEAKGGLFEEGGRATS